MAERPKNMEAHGRAAHSALGEGEFAAHFQKSHRVLWLVAAGILGDPNLAEDVVQDAAMIALDKLENFTPGTSFTAWMAQIVRNVSMNTARKETRRRSAPLGPDSDAAFPDPNSNGKHIEKMTELGADGRLPANQTWFDDRVMRALAEVSDMARACLLLRTIDSMEYSEISAVLSIPEGTAMSHVHRTRRLLRERLGDLWRERPSVSGGNA